MRHYVGLDVSMEETSICVIDERGKVIHETVVYSGPEQIAAYLQSKGLLIEKVGLESGSLSNWLTRELQKLALPAVCIDARQMAALLSTQINKNDKNDARGIAQALRGSYCKEVTIKSEADVAIRTAVTARKALIRGAVKLKNTLRGLLKSYGIRIKASRKEFEAKVMSSIDKNDIALSISVEALLSSIKSVNAKVEELECYLKGLAKEDEVVKVLMTVPGVGVQTALSFKTAIGDPSRFKNSKSVAAYLGLTPRLYESGETSRTGKISKCGDTNTRSLLVEAAVVHLTRTKGSSKLKSWGLKLAKKKGHKKAAVAVARKLAVILHRMLVTETPFMTGEERPSEGTPEGASKEAVVSKAKGPALAPRRRLRRREPEQALGMA